MIQLEELKQPLPDSTLIVYLMGSLVTRMQKKKTKSKGLDFLPRNVLFNVVSQNNTQTSTIILGFGMISVGKVSFCLEFILVTIWSRWVFSCLIETEYDVIELKWRSPFSNPSTPYQFFKPCYVSSQACLLLFFLLGLLDLLGMKIMERHVSIFVHLLVSLILTPPVFITTILILVSTLVSTLI